ncbi:MAG: hypothetical protein OXI05_04135 [Bacteroidota bacterium]|nr:hypothetical protein [Bacteroidota bacterium]MYE62320.1 hypothetical protein [Rhodothermaceae bacterium]
MQYSYRLVSGHINVHNIGVLLQTAQPQSFFYDLAGDVPGSDCASTPPRVLRGMNYSLTFNARTSGPVTAIQFDQKYNTLWGGASDHGDGYGIAW